MVCMITIFNPSLLVPLEHFFANGVQLKYLQYIQYQPQIGLDESAKQEVCPSNNKHQGNLSRTIQDGNLSTRHAHQSQVHSVSTAAHYDFRQ